MSLFEVGQYETQEWEQPGELNEFLELELTQELLEISNEAEFEEFLGKLVRSVARGAGKLIKSPIGKALGGVLRGVAKTALPMVGSALGTFVAPGIGTAIGGQLGSMASKLLEAEELESLGAQEAEFEAARRYVRWASGTVRNAMRPSRGVAPNRVVRSAAIASARRYAPALLKPTRSAQPQRWRQRRRGYRYYGPPTHSGCHCGAPEWSSDQFAGSGSYAADTDHGATPGTADFDSPDNSSEEFEDEFEFGGLQGESEFGGGMQGESEGETGSQYESAFESPFESSGQPASGRPSSGRWYRRGRRIVLLGV